MEPTARKSQRNAHVFRPSTLKREMHAALQSEISRLCRAQELINSSDEDLLTKAHQTFESSASAAKWLATPQVALANKIPLRVARTAKGAKSVRMVLGAIEHGVYL